MGAGETAMTITLNITPELEEVLRRSAQRAGLPPDSYILKLLQERLGAGERLPLHLPDEETQLLQKISQGLPPETWARYEALKEKRDARTLTPDEYAELRALTDEVELWNAHRLELVLALARLRQVPLRVMMDELGLTPPPYA
jgi:hypothetical protein